MSSVQFPVGAVEAADVIVWLASRRTAVSVTAEARAICSSACNVPLLAARTRAAWSGGTRGYAGGSEGPEDRGDDGGAAVEVEFEAVRGEGDDEAVVDGGGRRGEAGAADGAGLNGRIARDGFEGSAGAGAGQEDDGVGAHARGG